MVHLDGNVLAGVLSEIFRDDVTDARTWCIGCGHRSTVARGHVYLTAMGAVLRCERCSAVQLVVTRLDDEWHLDLSGTRGLGTSRA